MLADPTLAALAELDDPQVYALYRDVPVFRAHRVTRKLPDGSTQVIEVTDDDLYDICDRANASAQESGVPARITPGHTRPGRDVPEWDQPPPWGYATDFHVGTFGPGRVPAILAGRYYLRQDRVAEARTYPYRSPEYYPPSKEITGIALLRRDPELDLGIMSYGRGGVVYYAAEENAMPDDFGNGGVETAPTGPPGAPDPTTPPSPDTPSPEEMSAFMRCFKHGFPKLYEAANGPGFPGPGNTAPPALAKTGPGGGEEETDVEQKPPPDEAARMSREQQSIQYARLAADNKALRGEIAAIRYQAEEARCEQAVTQLEAEGYLIRDRARLAGQLARMDAAARAERLAEIRQCYQRDPSRLPEVPVLAGPAAGGRATTAEQRDAAVRLATRKGIDFDAALEQVKGRN
jgi:hypothetical protein